VTCYLLELTGSVGPSGQTLVMIEVKNSTSVPFNALLHDTGSVAGIWQFSCAESHLPAVQMYDECAFWQKNRIWLMTW
jgi:hypothetical protein